MRPPPFSFYHLLALPLFLSTTVVLGQATNNLICPDVSLQTYLITLIDILYANGLTIFEELLATLSESDSGYNLLEKIYTSHSLTLLVPTDSALQTANLHGPNFSSLTQEKLTNTLALHLLDGSWSYDKLPDNGSGGAGLHGVAGSLLSMGGYMNESDVGSNAVQVNVLSKGEEGKVVVSMAEGNGSCWQSPIDTGGELGNLIILPIDTVIQFPPSLSTALQLPLLPSQTQTLSKLLSVFNNYGGATPLEALTPEGFTIFAPVDSGFTDEAVVAGLESDGASVLGNHYTTNYTLYSPAWQSNPFQPLKVVSGSSLSINTNSSGSFVSLINTGGGGNVTARILRSDIPLENGVMHIIDKVLLPNKSSTPSSSSTQAANLVQTDQLSVPVSSVSSSSSSTSIPHTSNSSASTNLTSTSTSATVSSSSFALYPTSADPLLPSSESSSLSSPSSTASIPTELVLPSSTRSASPAATTVAVVSSAQVRIRLSGGLVGFVSGLVWLSA